MGTDSDMRREVAEAFASGLYHLATVDGVDEREVEVIRAFLDEVGHTDFFGELDSRPFDPFEAAAALETSFMQRLFLKSAIVLVRADGTISKEEMEALRGIATTFGQGPALDELLAETAGERIE